MKSESKPARISVVTGATGMLGRATAINLASRGALVVLVCRDRARGEHVLEEVKLAGAGRSHHLVIGDLSDPTATRGVAAHIRDSFEQIHALTHTAAIFTRVRQENAAGHELMFATNVLARILLTHELLSQLQRGTLSRIFFAAGPSPDRLAFDDLMARKKFQPFLQFRATNAANLLFAFELARRLDRSGVNANAYHPGALQSNLMREMPAIVRWITFPFGRQPDKAAHALSALALGDTSPKETGQFFKLEKPIKAPNNAQDVQAQRQLWDETKRLLGLERGNVKEGEVHRDSEKSDIS